MLILGKLDGSCYGIGEVRMPGSGLVVLHFFFARKSRTNTEPEPKSTPKRMKLNRLARRFCIYLVLIWFCVLPASTLQIKNECDLFRTGAVQVTTPVHFRFCSENGPKSRRQNRRKTDRPDPLIQYQFRSAHLVCEGSVANKGPTV